MNVLRVGYPAAMRIGQRTIGLPPAQPQPYIIAELGVNHDGSASRCLELVNLANDAGADAIKLQLFDPASLLSSAAIPAEYQLAAGHADPRVMLEKLQLSLADMHGAFDRARKLNMHCIVTVFSIEHVSSALDLQCDAVKTASPDVINRPLIEAMMATQLPLLVSCGAADADEIRAVTQWLGDHPHVLMQCVSAYPTPMQHASLAGRWAMMQINPNALGYSDHTPAVDTGGLAVASGACVLEKHLTYDRNAAGPDHAVSLDGDDFADYVRQARRAWAMLGRCEKRVLEIEQDVRAVARQSITTRHSLPAGHELSRDDLAIKRPGTGISPAQMNDVIGARTSRAVDADVPLVEDDLQ